MIYQVTLLADVYIFFYIQSKRERKFKETLLRMSSLNFLMNSKKKFDIKVNLKIYDISQILNLILTLNMLLT